MRENLQTSSGWRWFFQTKLSKTGHKKNWSWRKRKGEPKRKQKLEGNLYPKRGLNKIVVGARSEKRGGVPLGTRRCEEKEKSESKRTDFPLNKKKTGNEQQPVFNGKGVPERSGRKHGGVTEKFARKEVIVFNHQKTMGGE